MLACFLLGFACFACFAYRLQSFTGALKVFSPQRTPRGSLAVLSPVLWLPRVRLRFIGQLLRGVSG
jgi:hypothetical protein